MSRNNKYGNIDHEDLRRYIHGEMSDEERHDMERELQKDLFASEALEGLSTQSIEQVREDLEKLENKLNKRVKGRQSVIWIRIAASVAIILTIGTVYFTVFSDMLGRTDRMAVEAESQEEARDKGTAERPSVPLQAKTVEQDENEGSDDQKVEEDVPVLRIAEEIVEPQAVTAAAEPPGRSDEREAELRVQEETISSDDGAGLVAEPVAAAEDTIKFMEMEDAADQVLVAEELVEEPAEELALEIPAVQSRARSSEIAMPTAMPEAQEGELSGAGTTLAAKKQASALPGQELPNAIILSDSISASPVGGMDFFRNYIADNMRIPEDESMESGTAVVLSFRIDASGKPQDIIVIKGGGISFDREAIRLLQEGPDWTAAEINGLPTQEKIHLGINFSNQ